METRHNTHIGIGAALASLAAFGQRNLVPTIYTSAHRSRRNTYGSSGKRAPFYCQEAADRHARRVARWHRSKRAQAGALPPGHLRG